MQSDEACLSELLAITVHIMHCRNVKYHSMNFYLLKYTGETNTGRERCTLYKNSLNSTPATVQPRVSRIIISCLLNDMIRSSDLDRIYLILHLNLFGIMCSICRVLCMMCLLQNRHWGIFISDANM